MGTAWGAGGGEGRRRSGLNREWPSRRACGGVWTVSGRPLPFPAGTLAGNLGMDVGGKLGSTHEPVGRASQDDDAAASSHTGGGGGRARESLGTAASAPGAAVAIRICAPAAMDANASLRAEGWERSVVPGPKIAAAPATGPAIAPTGSATGALRGLAHQI